MNLAYVSREFGPVTGGGIGTYIANVCRAFTAAGHRVYLVTDCFARADRGLLPPGVTLVETLPSLDHQKGYFFNENQEYAYRVLHTLRQLASQVPLDVVEFPDFRAEGFAVIRAKRLLNEFAATRLIVKCHTPKSLLAEINESRTLQVDDLCDFEMEDYCVRHADLVTSPSMSLAQYFEARVGRTGIRSCPYPMHLPKLEAPRQFTPGQVRRVRFLGSVQVRKGVDTFLAAARRLLEQDPDFQFEIYGKDRNEARFGRPYQDLLQAQIPEACRDRIRFAGDLEYAAIPALLGDSCICVFPSRWENWANVCLEAMAMGCVVIASRHGGMAEMVRHGENGFLVDPLQPQEIADLILRHHADLQTLERLSRAAHQRSVELADPARIQQRIQANYESAVTPRHWTLDETSRVSVVIPYYNQGAYLIEALESVRQSTFPRLEIIVVNDGSTDRESNRIFDGLEGVRKVAQANGGLSAARNAGTRAATGDYVLMLDADDRIHPRYLETAVQALANCPDLAYVTCHAQNFGAFDSVYVPVGFVPALMPFLNTDGKCANLFRREALLQCGGYDESMVSYEDWDLLLTLHERGYRGDVLPAEFFYYRRRYDSMVYAVANPRRAELVQYMMLKHRALVQPHAGTMAVVLSRLWKEAEKAAEKLTSDETPIRWKELRRLFRKYLRWKARRLASRRR